MSMFKKKKGLLETLSDKVTSSSSKKINKKVSKAVATLKQEYNKAIKPKLADKILRRKKTTTQKIVDSSKAIQNAINKTHKKHSKSLVKTISEEAKTKSNNVNKSVKKTSAKVVHTASTSYNAVMATEIARSVDSFLRDSYTSASNVYDKAMDAARMESGHLGGDHRLFDGGHTLSAAWERVKGAVPDDSFIQELKGYVGAIKNDIITPEGLPLRTLNKDDFIRFVDETGVPMQWARDIASITGTEVLGAGIASLSIALNWNERDRERFSEFVGSSGIAAIASANPLLGVLTLSAAAIDYQAKGSKKLLTKGMARGAATTTAFVATSGAIGGPAAVGLMAGAVAAVCTSRILKKESLVEAEGFALKRIERLQL